MLIENSGCSYLKITDTEITNILQNFDSFEDPQIEITGKINCCNPQYNKVLEITEAINSWTVDLVLTTNNVLESITFTNALTGIVSTLDFSIKIDFTADLQDVTDAIATFLGVAVTQSVDNYASSSYLYTITLPTPFVPGDILNQTPATFTFEEVLIGDGEVEPRVESLNIYPAFFGLDTFLDGVYTIEIVITYDDQTFTYTQCFFVDCNIKCVIASKIELDNNIHILHYALTLASNCESCNCEDLCELYKRLVDELNSCDYSVTSIQDCNC